MYRVPAVKRMLADPNLQKLITCPCWKNGLVQCKIPYKLYGTRGSKFWSSKVCEGGESRKAYACRLNFGPPQFLFEINQHVTQTHFLDHSSSN